MCWCAVKKLLTHTHLLIFAFASILLSAKFMYLNGRSVLCGIEIQVKYWTVRQSLSECIVLPTEWETELSNVQPVLCYTRAHTRRPLSTCSKKTAVFNGSAGRESRPVQSLQCLLQMSPQYGELRPTGGWDRSVVWGTPANFDRFRILAALLHGTPVVGISQTLWRWTDSATVLYSAGRP